MTSENLTKEKADLAETWEGLSGGWVEDGNAWKNTLSPIHSCAHPLTKSFWSLPCGRWCSSLPAKPIKYDGEEPLGSVPSQVTFPPQVQRCHCRWEVGAQLCHGAPVITGQFASGCSYRKIVCWSLHCNLGFVIASRINLLRELKSEFVSSQKEFSQWKNSKSFWLWQDYSGDDSKSSCLQQDCRRDDVSGELGVST